MVRIIGHSTGSKTKKKALACFCLGAACLAYAVLVSCMDILQIGTTFMVQITNGSTVHQYLSKPIHAMYISVYLFNVTNPDAFMSGEDEKLKVEEVGPFTYTEYRYNDKLRICEEEGWMSYEPRSIISFLPNMSVADHDLVNVTMPSLPFLGLASTVSTYPAIARLGFSLLTSQFRSKAFVQTSASSYIWGYSDPIVGMANKVVPGLVTFDKLGLLDRLFDKKRKNSLVLNINGEDKYTVKTRNGHKKLNMADNADPDQCAICDDFKNTYEGVGYPSPITPDTPIRLFKSGVCRILPMVFDKKIVTEEGFDGFVYNLSDSFFSLNPNVSGNRLLDLTDCFYGLPVALSKVHFLDIDPKVYERIEGMKPDPSKNNYIIIEPKVALQLKSYFAVQFNLAMKDVSFLSEARPFSNMALPIGYVIINQPPLPQATVDVLKQIYTVFPIIIFTFKILCSILAAILIPYSVLLVFSKNKSISIQLSKVENQASVLQPFIAKDNEIF